MYTDPSGHYEKNDDNIDKKSKEYKDIIKAGDTYRDASNRTGLYANAPDYVISAVKAQAHADAEKARSAYALKTAQSGNTSYAAVKYGTTTANYMAASNKNSSTTTPTSNQSKNTKDAGKNTSNTNNTKGSIGPVLPSQGAGNGVVQDSTVLMPQYMKKVAQDMGADKAKQIYKLLIQGNGNISDSDAKKLGLDTFGVGLLECQYKLGTVGMTVPEYDAKIREENYAAAMMIIGFAAGNASIAKFNNLPKVPEPNGVNQGTSSTKIPWGKWSDYEKVTANGQEYAKVGDRLYSRHAVDRMQPSGNRYGSSITQAGGDYGRSVAPQYVEDVISSVKPIVQENGNLKYVGGSLEVVTNPQGAVVTIMTK